MKNQKHGLFIQSALFGKLLVLVLVLSHTLLFSQHPYWDSHLCTSHITGIAPENNDLWLTAFGGGLMKFDPASASTTFYNKHNSAIPTVFMKNVVVDSAGYKWIGSDDEKTGLIRFDGINNWVCYNTQNCPIPNNDITSLKVYGNDLWVGTYSGLAKFDGLNWTVFTSVIAGSTPYPINYVADIEFDTAGNMWVCCSAVGLMKFDGTSWKVYTNANSGIHNTYNYINSVAFDTTGNILVAHSQGLTIFDGTNWTYTASPPGNFMDVVRTDLSGNIYCRSDEALFKFNTGTWQYIGPGPMPSYFWYGPSQSYGHVFYIAPNGDLWYTRESGLSKYNGIWTDFTPAIKSELTTPGITDCKFFPSTHTLYSGTILPHYKIMGSGLTIFENSMWTQANVVEPCQQANFVKCLDGAPNMLWMGIRNGVSYFDGNSLTNFYYQSCPTSEFTTALTIYNHALYAGTTAYQVAGRLMKYDSVNWTLLPTPLQNYQNSAVTDIKSWGINLLIACNHGLILYDTAGVSTQYTTMNSGLPSDTVNAVLVDNSNSFIWLVTDKGLARTDLVTWTTYTISTTVSQINKMTCLAQDDLGNLWVGTASYGIALFNGSTFTVFNTDNSGLTDDRITSMTVGDNYELWVGTYEGGMPSFHYGTWLSDNNLSPNTDFAGSPELKISPNPSIGNTNIDIRLNEPGQATVIIYNQYGQKIKTLTIQNSGNKTITLRWDGRNDFGEAVKPGLYFCELTNQNRRVTEKLVLVR